jgi:hypothetical protein
MRICIDVNNEEILITTDGSTADETIHLPRDRHSARNAAHYAEVKLFAFLYEDEPHRQQDA